jgi:hypothetical protein
MPYYAVTVTVTRTVARARLDADDRRLYPERVWTVLWADHVANGDVAMARALDWFHDHHAIACLEHFDIDATVKGA